RTVLPKMKVLRQSQRNIRQPSKKSLNTTSLSMHRQSAKVWSCLSQVAKNRLLLPRPHQRRQPALPAAAVWMTRDLRLQTQRFLAADYSGPPQCARSTNIGACSIPASILTANTTRRSTLQKAGASSKSAGAAATACTSHLITVMACARSMPTHQKYL